MKLNGSNRNGEGSTLRIFNSEIREWRAGAALCNRSVSDFNPLGEEEPLQVVFF
jgi:hypothetical protein